MCHAVVMRNKENGRVALLHVERHIDELRDYSPHIERVIEFLGEGEKEAIYLQNSRGWASRSESYLKHRGIQTADFITIDETRFHWNILFRPKTNQIAVYTNKKALLFDAFDNVNMPGVFSQFDEDGAAMEHGGDEVEGDEAEMTKVVVLLGASGSGKSTFRRKFMADHSQEGAHFVPIVTNRDRKSNEPFPKEFVFLSKEEFESQEKSGDIVFVRENFGGMYNKW